MLILGYKSDLETTFFDTAFVSSIGILEHTGVVNLASGEVFRFHLNHPESREQFTKVCRVKFHNAIPKEFNL